MLTIIVIIITVFGTGIQELVSSGRKVVLVSVAGAEYREEYLKKISRM